MDLLRSCYRRVMRFYPGGPDVPVTWYFCKPGAKVFDGVHAFGSAIWDAEKGLVSELGDQATKPMTYSKGASHNLSDGQSFAGPVEYFQVGQGQDRWIDRWGDSTPTQCVPVLPIGQAGKIVGTESEFITPLPVNNTPGAGKIVGSD